MTSAPPRPKRRVLMVQYIFPPIGGSAVHRNLGFARYLPDSGWLPIVVCGSSDAHGQGLDPSLVQRIPAEVQVFRRRFVSALGPRRWARRLVGFADRPQAASLPADQLQLGGAEGPAPGAVPQASDSLARRALRVLAWPLRPIEHPPVDAGLYWALSVVPLCLRLIRREKVDVLLSQSYPYSDHVAGMLVHCLTGVPWVADFHDPYSRNAVFQHTGWRRRADLWLERQVLRHAASVIACSAPYTQDFRELAPRRDPSDFVTITNGFDAPTAGPLPEAEEEPSLWPPSRKVTLAHVGHVFPGTAIPFLRALEGLEPAVEERLRVFFVGGLARPDWQWLREHPVDVEIHTTPRLPMAPALRAMRAADAVLALVGTGPLWTGHIPGKLFDYLSSGTPVLLFGPQGASAGLVEECGAGCRAPVEDLEACRARLTELALDPVGFRASCYHPLPEQIRRFDRTELARCLAQVLDRVVRPMEPKSR